MRRTLWLVGFIALLSCETEEGPLCPVEQQCFRGLVHADCGGEGATMRCVDGAAERCLWIDAACVLPTYWDRPRPEDPALRIEAGWYRPNWGPAVWSRDTAMTVEVVESADAPPIAGDDATIECACETMDGADGPCLSGSNDLCRPDAERGVALIRRDDWQPDNGTLAYFIGAIMRPTGYELVTEVDVERRRARVCLVGYHDASLPMPDPQCAAAGRITLSSVDPVRLAAGKVDFTLHAEFGPIEPTSALDPALAALTVRLRIPAGRPSLSTRPSP